MPPLRADTRSTPQSRPQSGTACFGLDSFKTSMGMEVLRCKSPQLLHKELEMFFIAYNLIRCLMAQAGVSNDVELDRLSFKGTVDSLRQFSLAIAQARSRKKQNQLIAELLEVMARDQVPERPDRREPRAVKRRPKAYQLLNRPRHAMKEISETGNIGQDLAGQQTGGQFLAGGPPRASGVVAAATGPEPARQRRLRIGQAHQLLRAFILRCVSFVFTVSPSIFQRRPVCAGWRRR